MAPPSACNTSSRDVSVKLACLFTKLATITDGLRLKVAPSIGHGVNDLEARPLKRCYSSWAFAMQSRGDARVTFWNPVTPLRACSGVLKDDWATGRTC